MLIYRVNKSKIVFRTDFPGLDLFESEQM